MIVFSHVWSWYECTHNIILSLCFPPFTVSLINIYMAAAAIAIHNFPEGIATFIVGLATPILGIALAVAIAVHNIPEGASVAIPIYYATGKKWKGLLWAFLSGISEPFGEDN